MELPYNFKVTNIKFSVTLPRPVCLDSVIERCSKLQTSTSLYCSRKTKNIITIRYNNFTYVPFKSSSRKLEDGSVKPNHCNIMKCRTQTDILTAIQDILFLVHEPPQLLDYKIDNYSCIAHIHRIIDTRSLFLRETELQCSYQEGPFPSVSVRCPTHLTSAPNQVCNIYRTGYITLVGGKVLTEVESFFVWLLKFIEPHVVT